MNIIAVGKGRSFHFQSEDGRYVTRYGTGDRKSGFQYWFDTQDKSPFGGLMGSVSYHYVFGCESGKEHAAKVLNYLLSNK